jgi:hypothetical protein
LKGWVSIEEDYFDMERKKVLLYGKMENGL